MEVQKEGLRSTKRELTEEVRNMSIDALDGMEEDYSEALKSVGITTLGELLNTNTDQLYDILKTQYASGYWPIRNAVMKMGFLFNDDHLEFERLGISDDVALIPINNLGISTRLKNSLARRGKIYFFGDLLSRDYASLIRLRNLGEESLTELKKYVHSLGYTLKDEEPTLSDIQEEYKAKGIPMLQEELGLDSRTCGVLYRNGIYTVQDIMNYGENIFSLVGMGDLKAQKLKEAMKSKNVYFGTTVTIPSEGPAAVMPSKEVVDYLKQENTAIKVRIKLKEDLISEYDRLIEERHELMLREKKLDEEIADRVAILQSIEQNEEVKSYGGK